MVIGQLISRDSGVEASICYSCSPPTKGNGCDQDFVRDFRFKQLPCTYGFFL